MTDYQSKHRFSLRKYSIGLASVLLGMALLANPLIAKADDAQIASVAESTISLLSLDSVLENSSANPETELDTETSLGTEVAEDRQAPQLISITTNKTDYQAGETVLVRVEARDESSLSSAYVSFRNESNTHSLGNGIYDSSQFHQLPNGHYVVEIPINIPLTRPSDRYTLSWISLKDTIENEVTYSSSEYETNKVEALELTITGTVTDRNAPHLISISTDKTEYRAGETISVQVEVSDESALSSAYVSFRNESNTHSLGNGIYDSSQFHQLPNGHYVVEIPINIPLTRPSDRYTLSWISLRDTVENEVTYSSSEYETNKVEALELTITGTVTDRNAPHLISISTDKTEYRAGETISVQVEVSDESALSSAYVSFRNESNTHSLGNGIYDSSQFHQLPNGHYVVEIPINIPLTRPSDHYTLSWISLRDTVENEVTYSSSEYETNKIEPLTIVIGKPSQPIETVTTPPSNATPNPDSTEEVDKPELPDAPVEVTSPELPDTSVDLIERDVVNLVVVVDEGTGRELFRFTINGEDYASQVTEKIAAYSLENQMSLTEGSHLLVSEQRSATTVGNYTKESIRREYKVSVKRDSELPLPEENTGFVPSGTLYDDVNSYRAAFDVGVYANGDQISSSDYIGTDTIDAVIRRALESVDSERYRYDRVEVNQGFTSRFGNGVNFSGQLFDIKVFLTEFQMKPIEPFISSETQPDLGKSPIVETGTSDVDVPKNESTTAPEISPETSDSLKTQPDLGKSPIVEIGTSDVDVPKNESTTAPEISPETSDSLKTQPDLGKSPIVEIGTPDVNIPQIGSETSSDKPIFSELPSESDDLTKISGLLKNGSDMAIASPPAKELTREMMHQSVKSPMSQIATEGKTADKSASLPRTNSTSSIIVAVVGLVSVSLGLLGLKKQER